jgi:hypothetical protein
MKVIICKNLWFRKPLFLLCISTNKYLKYFYFVLHIIFKNMSVKIPSTTPSAPATTPATDQYRLPDATTLQNTTKIAISEDKPIMMDYWTSSLEKTSFIGVREGGEKMLVKSEEEYTSPIQKIFKVGNDFVIMTENSIYLVDNKIPMKRIA